MRIRPIQASEIDAFSRIGAHPERVETMRNALEELWASGDSRPEWCFVAEAEDGKLLGRVGYWAFLSSSEAAKLMALQLPWQGDYLEIGLPLLRQSLAAMKAHGAQELECRIYGDLDALTERQALLTQLGLPIRQEKTRFLWQEPYPLASPVHVLHFQSRAQVGDAAFTEAIRLVSEDTLDPLDREEIAAVGPHLAAQQTFLALQAIDDAPARWQLAANEAEELVGLVVPQVFTQYEGALHCVGVTPAFRERISYLADLLVHGSRLLQNDGVTQIVADVDAVNLPLIQALRLIGYQQVQQMWRYAAPLESLLGQAVG